MAPQARNKQPLLCWKGSMRASMLRSAEPQEQTSHSLSMGQTNDELPTRYLQWSTMHPTDWKQDSSNTEGEGRPRLWKTLATAIQEHYPELAMPGLESKWDSHRMKQKGSLGLCPIHPLLSVGVGRIISKGQYLSLERTEAPGGDQ